MVKFHEAQLALILSAYVRVLVYYNTERFHLLWALWSLLWLHKHIARTFKEEWIKRNK